MEEILYLFTFEGSGFSIRAEKLLESKKIPNKIISLPSELSASCGLAIQVRPEYFEESAFALSDLCGVTGCYRVTKTGIKKKYEPCAAGYNTNLK